MYTVTYYSVRQVSHDITWESYVIDKQSIQDHSAEWQTQNLILIWIQWTRPKLLGARHPAGQLALASLFPALCSFLKKRPSWESFHYQKSYFFLMLNNVQ